MQVDVRGSYSEPLLESCNLSVGRVEKESSRVVDLPLTLEREHLEKTENLFVAQWSHIRRIQHTL